MIEKDSPESRAITIEKLFLILGVVLIHCNFISDFDIAPTGKAIIEWGSQCVCGMCVPSFFIISGLLFFNGVRHFTKDLYVKKLRSRVHTLLIPYLLWNLIASIVLIFKCKVLGFPSFGVFNDGKFDFLVYLKGYWILYDQYPFEFAFWFLRRLIIFVIISPSAWIAAGNKWIVIGLFLAKATFSINLYGFEYFILGATLSRLNVDVNIIDNYKWQIPILFLLSTIVLSFIPSDFIFNDAIIILRNLLGAVSFYILSVFANDKGFLNNKAGKTMVKSTFIIYAVHSLFPALVRKAIASGVGVETVIGTITTYLLSWITLVTLSFIAYIILELCFPKMLKILTGNRS